MPMVTTVVTRRVPHQHTITKTETDSDGNKHTTTETITVIEVVREVIRKWVGEPASKPPEVKLYTEEQLEEQRRRVAQGFVGTTELNGAPAFGLSTGTGMKPFALDGASDPNLLFADEERLEETIRYLAQQGADTLRVFASYDGSADANFPWADTALLDHAGLINQSDPAALDDPAVAAAVQAEIDFVTARLKDLPRIIAEALEGTGIDPASFKVVVSLADYYQSGGTIPGTSAYYESYDGGPTVMSHQWFEPGSAPFLAYQRFVDQVVGANADNPAIAAWEIGNELQVAGAAPSAADYQRFVDFFHWSASHLKETLGAQQMVGTGVIGSRHFLNAPQGAGEIYRMLHDDPNVDFASIHMYAGDFNRSLPMYEQDLLIAAALGKPVFLGETAVPFAAGSAAEVDGIDYYADEAARRAELESMLGFMDQHQLTARAWWGWSPRVTGGPTEMSAPSLEERWRRALQAVPAP